MPIINQIKSALGLTKDHPSYECVECGNTFESAGDPDGPWFQCPECGTEDPLGTDDE